MHIEGTKKIYKQINETKKKTFFHVVHSIYK